MRVQLSWFFLWVAVTKVVAELWVMNEVFLSCCFCLFYTIDQKGFYVPNATGSATCLWWFTVRVTYISRGISAVFGIKAGIG